MSSRIVIAMLAALSAACGGAQAKAERFMTAGDGYFDEGRNYAAAIEYRNAIKQLPDSSTAHRKLGLAHWPLGMRRQPTVRSPRPSTSIPLTSSRG